MLPGRDRQGVGLRETAQPPEPATIALTTAVLLALQTSIKFKAEQGKPLLLEIEKKAAGDATLKLVVQHLLAYLNPTLPKT